MLTLNRRSITKRTGDYHCIHEDSGLEVRVIETTNYYVLFNESTHEETWIEQLKDIETEAGQTCFADIVEDGELRSLNVITICGMIGLSVLRFTPTATPPTQAN